MEKRYVEQRGEGYRVAGTRRVARFDCLCSFSTDSSLRPRKANGLRRNAFVLRETTRQAIVNTGSQDMEMVEIRTR